jgi:hypothetical protein
MNTKTSVTLAAATRELKFFRVNGTPIIARTSEKAVEMYHKIKQQNSKSKSKST